jgi:acyl-[acyl-carrier-protein] desaturase
MSRKLESVDAFVEPQFELLRDLSAFVGQHLNLLTAPSDAWQPSDYLPDFGADDWRDQLETFRAPAAELSDELLVVLVGDMVTEEALPNYAVSLNLLAHDQTGTSPDPWARWLRGWTAEENRHGDLLNAFLRLTGRVDMRAVEVTVHNLITNGFNPKAHPNPYAGLIYTSFQECATKISHMNVGKLAQRSGNAHLGKICKRIAGDEARHETFYTRMMSEVMKRDPERGVLVFREMLRRIITMPGRLMGDGGDPSLFDGFAVVAQRTKVYTIYDYAGIIRHLVETWKVATLTLSGKAAAAQEFLCKQAERLESLAEMLTDEVAKQEPATFSWIHGRRV